MTHVNPGALSAIVKALNKAMPVPVVEHQYLADLIVMTLRGSGYGIETYPEITAKRQAALIEGDHYRNHGLKGALSYIAAAVRDYQSSLLDQPYPIEDEVMMYLASAGYRIVVDKRSPADVTAGEFPEIAKRLPADGS